MIENQAHVVISTPKVIKLKGWTIREYPSSLKGSFAVALNSGIRVTFNGEHIIIVHPYGFTRTYVPLEVIDTLVQIDEDAIAAGHPRVM